MAARSCPQSHGSGHLPCENWTLFYVSSTGFFMAKRGYQLSSSQYHMSLLYQHSVACGGLCLEACDCSLGVYIALNFSATLFSLYPVFDVCTLCYTWRTTGVHWLWSLNKWPWTMSSYIHTPQRTAYGCTCTYCMYIGSLDIDVDTCEYTFVHVSLCVSTCT